MMRHSGVADVSARYASRGRVLTASLVAALTVLVALPQARADIAIDPAGKLKVFGDFRFRFETDWNSHQANGIERPDRDRARIRARLGLRLQPTEVFALALRVRTGSKDSQQSPHITIADFDGNPTGDDDILFDQWYGELKGESGWAWFGRKDFPFWKQNELFWDDDATIAGAAFGYRRAAGSELDVRAGAFALPDGGVEFNGWMGAGQLVYVTKLGFAELTLAGGLYALEGEAGAKFLRNGNGERDYVIGMTNLQARIQALGQPLSFGLDLMHNFQDYSTTDSDAFTAANHDQTNGVVVQTRLGSLDQGASWLAGVYSDLRCQRLLCPGRLVSIRLG